MSVRHFVTGTIILVVFAGVYMALVNDAFGQAASSTEATGVSITISEEGGGGGGTGVKNPANVTFRGFAYPGAIVTFLGNGATAGTAVSAVDGTFIKMLTVDPGFVTFGIWARDNLGLVSATTNIPISVAANSNIEISNIFLSPTITADRFRVQKDSEAVRIFGTVLPESLVRLFSDLSSGVSSPAEVRADSGGRWEYSFSTEGLGKGTISIRANAEMDGAPYLVSAFSNYLELTIAEIVCSGADFNIDERVNIIDFSILIFYWEKDPSVGEITNICVDLNNNRIVDIYDFSILMHEWTD